jgi:hypothetical protein
MKTLSVLALVALVASCHFDKLFTGGGGTQLSHEPPAGLAFTSRPANARAGQPLGLVRVAVVDLAGTPVAGADSLIMVRLGSNPSSATLTGTNPAHAVNGVATFSDLRISEAGTGYTLIATVAGLTPDTSAAFDVTPPPPTTGSVRVTTATTGATPDPDGYSVAVDGGASQAIGNTDTVTFSGLTAASHTVGLTGLAANCTASGGTSRNVNVAVGDTAPVSFAVSCPTPPPTTGDLTVTTTTGGGGTDPNGYTVTVDGDARSIGVSGSVTFSAIPAGDHAAALSGIASNCTVLGLNPRTINVPAGGANQTNFTVTCNPPANQPPTAAFTSSCNGLACSFTSTSSDPDGTIASQQWAFGDQTTGSGATPSHTYGAAGKYTVTLTVTDNQGAQGVVTHDVTVTSFTQPPVVIAGPDQHPLVGLVFSLDGASFSDPDHDGPWTVTIDWGDGSQPRTFSASEGPITGSHSYTGVALTQYTLTVTVVDAHGNRNSASKTVTIALL